ncbi:MAG: class I adenylate-forming enzyme family protein [Novosphingobium sp.]
MPKAPEHIFTEVSTVGDLLLRAAYAQPDREAVVLPERSITYRSLREGAERFAASLSALGVEPGRNIGLFLPNSIDYVEAFFGIALLGCVAVPLNIRHKGSEIGYIIADAELSALVTSGADTEYVDLPKVLLDALPSLKQYPVGARDPLALPEAPALRHIINMAGADAPGMLPRQATEAPGDTGSSASIETIRRRVRVRDTALILYTSGTTAAPKGCMLSHEAVTRGPVERARYRLSNGDHDVAWGAGPLFHIAPLAGLIGSVGVAGTYLTDSFFDPGRAIEMMVRHRVTVAWPWFSAIVQGVVDHPDFDPKALPDLRHLFIIAPEALVERMQDLLPQTEIIQGCGMTETAGIFAINEPQDDRHTRSTTQGRPFPGVEVRIVNPDDGRDQPAGAMGEIWVRGYNVMDGYYRNPEQTAAALTPDRWLRTGDLYTSTREGNLIFGGRLKDMLKVGGENVATMEVEAFLCSHPDVKLAEVVGMPDPRLDEVPVAFVELRDGALVSPDALIAFCKGRIASYKIPRRIFLVSGPDWPMSATKVDKRVLRERVRLSLTEQQ